MISQDTKVRPRSEQHAALAVFLHLGWKRLFSQDVMFFANCPAATWPQFGEMLSWQFLTAAKRELAEEQLQMIARKLFGTTLILSSCVRSMTASIHVCRNIWLFWDNSRVISFISIGIKTNYDNCNVAWSKFTKVRIFTVMTTANSPQCNGTRASWGVTLLSLSWHLKRDLWSQGSRLQENPPDTFWVWFDGILVMVKTYLEDLWREGWVSEPVLASLFVSYCLSLLKFVNKKKGPSTTILLINMKGFLKSDLWVSLFI